jgi:hypothetical protein
LTLSADGARQALLDHFLVNKLTADVADLKAVIVAKDSIITRLNQSVCALAIKPPDAQAKQLDHPGASARPVVKPPIGPKPLVSFNRPKIENWFWRGLFAYIAIQAIRGAIIAP